MPAFPLTVLCHPRCSTCEKALTWLDGNGITYSWRSIIDDNPTAEELRTWIPESGLGIRRFFNTSGMAYRENNVKVQLDEWSHTLSDNDQLTRAIDLLSSDGMLCKRPLVIDATGKFVAVGFKENEWEATLL